MSVGKKSRAMREKMVWRDALFVQWPEKTQLTKGHVSRQCDRSQGGVCETTFKARKMGRPHESLRLAPARVHKELDTGGRQTGGGEEIRYRAQKGLGATL